MGEKGNNQSKRNGDGAFMRQDGKDRYLKSRFYHGQSALARAVDYAALRLLIFILAFLFFRGRCDTIGQAALLSAIALALIMIPLRLVRLYRYESFVLKETARLQEKLFLERLCRMPEAALRALSRPHAKGAKLIVLRRAEKADADAVLTASSLDGRAALLATGGYTPFAKTFAASLENGVALIEPADLLPDAEALGFLPDEEDAFDRMRLVVERAKDSKKRLRAAVFSGAFPGKYFLTAALLIVLSFFTRYAVYYRLLAILSTLIATVGALFSGKNDRTVPLESE